MAFLNFFFGPKKSSCCTKNPIIDPIFLLDHYFSVLEETKSPLNGFLSSPKKNSGWTPLYKESNNKTTREKRPLIFDDLTFRSLSLIGSIFIINLYSLAGKISFIHCRKNKLAI